MSDENIVKFVLVTQERCFHCIRVSREFLPQNEDKLSSVAPFLRVHLRNSSDFEKIPQEIRKHVKIAPQLYAIYNDGTFSNVNPLEIKNVDRWIRDVLVEGETRAGPKMTLLIVLAESCHNCTKWKENGELDKFIHKQKERYGNQLFVQKFTVDKPAEDLSVITERSWNIVRRSLAGLPVPFLVALPYNIWKNPNQETINRNLYPAVADPRSSDGKYTVQKWLDELVTSDEGLLYYLVLSTSETCPHCINWKKSGGEAEFKRKFSTIDGILLVHNGFIPHSIKSKIPYVPSILLVPKDQWTKNNPNVIQGPDPRDLKATENWLHEHIKRAQWNNSDKIPEEYPRPQRSVQFRRSTLRSL